jgi:hypothetical protein
LPYSACRDVKSFDPSSLPAIDQVDVVDLRAVDPNSVAQYMDRAADAPSVRTAGVDAQRIAAPWRALSPGEQMRCHVPPFGLRFYAAGRLICEASLCWQCNNLFGREGSERVAYVFDASTAAARELLAACERAFGRAGGI